MMQFFSRFGFVVFAVLAILDITFLGLEYNNLRFYTKPLILPSLLITILASTKHQQHPTSKLIVMAAFVAGTVGDLLLLKDKWFVPGLICFLVMQLLYCVYFFKMHGLKRDNILANLFIAFILATFGFLLVGGLYKFLGGLKIPVIMYAAVILTMMFAAINVAHSRRAQKLALQNFIPGAGLLVLSDSILAINKFFLKGDFFFTSVMVTYVVGQMLMSIGFIRHLKSDKHSSKRRSSRSSHTGDTEPAV